MGIGSTTLLPSGRYMQLTSGIEADMLGRYLKSNNIMTKLLKKAIEEAENLSEDKQDLIASVILEEIDADRRWDELFEKTTDAQWQTMVDQAKQETEEEGVISGGEFLTRAKRIA